MFTVQQLEKIEKTWRQDAESEQDEYYFETQEFQEIADGSKAFVISRKGTGKSAIVMHLKATAKHAVHLSLSDLDPEELHGLGSEPNATQKSLRYRNSFAYVIYRAVAVMMLNSDEVSDAAKGQIQKAFPEQVQEELPSNVMRWMKLKSFFEVFDVGAGFEVQREKQENKYTILDKKNILEAFLAKHLKGGPYYVIFDALDENFRAAHGRLEPEYGVAITSLFKTVSDIRQQFKKLKLFPVITLRDDIFDFLQHAERNRWRDATVEIAWSEDKIKQMIAHRIALTTGENPGSFTEVWTKLVGREKAKINARVWEKYEYIASFTMLRPRDFIAYLREACAEAARRVRERPACTDQATATLSVPVLKECKGAFSKYFRDELEDELGGQIPDIKVIFDAVLTGPNRAISRREFETRYGAYLQTSAGEQSSQNCAEMLNKLYQFGVVGASGEKFRFNGGGAKLPPMGGLLIHKGLIRSRDEDKVLFEE